MADLPDQFFITLIIKNLNSICYCIIFVINICMKKKSKGYQRFEKPDFTENCVIILKSAYVLFVVYLYFFLIICFYRWYEPCHEIADLS